MSLKAPIEVHSLKAGRVAVRTLLIDEVTTADFVNSIPKYIHRINGVFKSVLVGRQEIDLRELNRARQGQKEPEPELTAASSPEPTR